MESRFILLTAALLVAQIAAPLVESKSSHVPSSAQKPHIIVILADDLGWNDVSFHGSAQIPTPNIDALAYNGIILNQHYVPALCTPSRSSLMTGKYPTHTGMQHLVILAPEPWGLPLSEKLLPEYLKEAGYSTHAIGKWHLGFHRSEYTPTRRGFDSHFGYWNGYHDYYDHTMRATLVPYKGYDMRRNMSVDWESQGRYSTDLFTEEAVRIIEHHDPEGAPLFLYLAHLAPHAGNAEEPFQAPDEVVAKFAHIEDPERRIYAAMVSKLDESVGEVMAALRAKGMLQNSIVLFMSDNGGPTFGVHSNRGSNYPLKGMKESPWEGGVRGAAAIWSPLIKSNQRVSNQLMHIADWLPTFYTAAGMDVRNLENIDGHDMWEALSENLDSPRIEVLHNIDPIEDYAALRMGEWKYVTGTTQGGITDGWYGESGRENEDLHREYDVSAILRSKAGVAITGVITKLQVKAKNEALLENNESSGIKYRNSHLRLLTETTVTTLRHQAEVHCDKQPPETSNNSSTACRPLEAPCLFNIKDDPCEQINLAASRPLVLFTLEDRLAHFRRSMVIPRNVPGDPMANPVHWNGTWVSWKDEQPSVKLPLPGPTSDLGTIGTIVLLVFLLGAVFISIIFVALKSVLKGLPEKTSFFFSIFPGNSKSVDLHTKQPEEVK